MVRRLLPLLALATLAAGCMRAPAPPESGGPPPSERPVLIFTPPPDWEVQPQTMPIFLGQWSLPEGAIANVSYMPGQDSAEAVASNVQRWVGQFEVPDSTPQQAVRMESVEGHYPEQRILLKGTLVSTNQVGGGDPRMDWMLVGAVLSTKVGPIYVKILGPREQLEPELESLWALVGTMRVE